MKKRYKQFDQYNRKQSKKKYGNKARKSIANRMYKMNILLNIFGIIANTVDP